MQKRGWAEWMLACRFGPRRANEVCGDLLEQYKPWRVNLEMFRLALGADGAEMAGLVVVSLAMTLIQHALFSAWPLQLMRSLQDAYVGWAWSMCSSLGLTGLASWLVTASSALRLGTFHRLTRCSFALSIAMSVLSGFMLQPQLRHISPALIAGFLLWRLRVSGVTTTTSCLVATGTAVYGFLSLFSTVRLDEIHACSVQMRSVPQPTSFTFYSACSAWAAHVWLLLFTGTFFSVWLVTFLPSGRYDETQKAAPTLP